MNIDELIKWIKAEFSGVVVDKGINLYNPVDGFIEIYRLNYNSNEAYVLAVNEQANIILKNNKRVSEEAEIKLTLKRILYKF